MLTARVFTDFYVKACDDKLLKVAYRLGYSNVACEELKTSPPQGGPSVYSKVVIRVGSVAEAKRALASLSYKKYLITLLPEEVEPARWACHDSRVDTILLTPENIEVFDKKQFSTMKYYAKPLELQLKHLVEANESIRSAIYRRLNLAVRYKVGVVVGSGASSWVELVHPYSIVKLLATTYDFPQDLAILSITDIPRQIMTMKERSLTSSSEESLSISR